MSGLGAYVVNEILDHIFLTGDYASESNLFVALLTTAPDKDDSGSSLPGEVSGAGYARVTCDTWDAAGTAEATENTQPVTFAQAAADWGTVKYFCVMNHITTGDQIGWGALTASRVISSGDTARFATGDLDVSIADSA
jgi:hypothetical protein